MPFSVVEVNYRTATVMLELKLDSCPINLVCAIHFDVIVEFFKWIADNLKIVSAIHNQAIALASDITATTLIRH